jgi:hypothetical protein
MLDEAEYGPVHRLVLAGVRAVSAGAAGDEFAAARAEFERVAGELAVGSSFTHHRLARFGPPCGSCGRPLRTREASGCVECGVPNPALQQTAASSALSDVAAHTGRGF